MAFLNLAEFMEHQDRPLPIDSKTLGELSFTFQAYAKALHYKELEFFTDNSHPVLESLLNINQKLQQHDAAFGVLKAAKLSDGHFDLARHEEWFERLGRWQEALEGYTRMADADPDALDVSMGRIRCLHALGEWEQLARIVDDNWERAGHEDRKRIAPLAAAAAWSLNDWDAMDDYIAAMSNDSPDRFFYRAILSVHRNHFPKAVAQIERARDLLESEFTPLIGEDYGRSYKCVAVSRCPVSDECQGDGPGADAVRTGGDHYVQAVLRPARTSRHDQENVDEAVSSCAALMMALMCAGCKAVSPRLKSGNAFCKFAH